MKYKREGVRGNEVPGKRLPSTAAPIIGAHAVQSVHTPSFTNVSNVRLSLSVQFIGGDAAARSLKKNHPEFEVFSEIEVTGPNTHPLYKFLTNQLPGRWSP